MWQGFLLNKFFLAGAIIALAVSFGGGWKVRDWKADADQLDLLRLQSEALAAQQEEYEKEISQRDEKARVLEGKLELLRRRYANALSGAAKEYAKDSYTACSVPASGVQRINDAIEAANEAATAR